MLCMNHQQNPWIALTWAPEGKRSRGQPRETWWTTVEEERQKMGFTTWNEAVATARDIADTRRQVHGPVLPEEGQMMMMIRICTISVTSCIN